MDETTSRTQSTSRRMATTKPAGTTRRSSSNKGSGKGAEPEVSRARWGGVALVIAAIAGAIILAIISPSDPAGTIQSGEVVAPPSPTPSAAVLDMRVPTVQPTITNPSEGETGEVEIPVTVELPDEELPKRLLTLVILRGDEVLKELDNPKTGGAVTVKGVRLDPGVNELTAALATLGGLGPISEPVVMTLDLDKPSLAITSPKNKYQTLDDRVLVVGTSEVGVEVQVRNEANEFDQTVVVGNSGEFAVTVRLKRDVNRIVVTSTDSVGLDQADAVRVTRLDGRPTVKVKSPEGVKRSDLPAKVRIVVDVTDADDKPMNGAEVSYTLGGPAWISQSEVLLTNDNGRSVWNPEIEPSSSPAEAIELGVTVTSPTSGDPKVVDRKIRIN